MIRITVLITLNNEKSGQLEKTLLQYIVVKTLEVNIVLKTNRTYRKEVNRWQI